MSESEHDRVMRLRDAVKQGGAVFVPGTDDSTHCENCNGGCPSLCTGWTHRPPPEGRLRRCKTAEDRQARLERGGGGL